VTRRRIGTEPIAETESGHLTEFRYDDSGNDDGLVCAAHGGASNRGPGTGEYGGIHPENFVNWLAADGAEFQFELGETTRDGENDLLLGALHRILRSN